MHVGNLHTALYTWCIARHAHGKFLLRIEDTDQSRQVEGAVEVIYKTLRDCGLDHDEGPDVGGPVGPAILQTERRDTYLPYAKRLVERGHAYYCFCDKTESEEDSGDYFARTTPAAIFPRKRCNAVLTPVCRGSSARRSPTRAKRRSTTRSSATSPRRTPISTIRCSSSATGSRPTTSQTSLTIISWASPTSCAAAKYLSSAPKYNLLYEGLGWNVPSYVHCSPVMRDAHSKMSKRHGDPRTRILSRRASSPRRS